MSADNRIVDELRDAMLVSAALARHSAENAELDEIRAELESQLHEVFRVLAKSTAAETGWTSDDQAPGYLIRRNNELEIRLPFHLVRDFPQDESLDEIISFAAAVRSHNGSVVCISGSATQYGTLRSVGDVDFCEYVDVGAGNDARLSESVKHAMSIARDALFCFRVVVGRAKKRDQYVWPWTDQEEAVSEPGSISFTKCDFIADTTFEGVLALTKVVLPAGSDRRREDRDSHPLQEVPISPPGGWFPRRLHSPHEVGSYVNFLVNDIRERLEVHPVKAAKRALSLARLLFRADDAAMITNVLKRTTLLPLASLQSRLKLKPLVDAAITHADLPQWIRHQTDATLTRLCNACEDALLREIAAASEGSLHSRIQEIADRVEVILPTHRECAEIRRNLSSFLSDVDGSIIAELD